MEKHSHRVAVTTRRQQATPTQHAVNSQATNAEAQSQRTVAAGSNRGAKYGQQCTGQEIHRDMAVTAYGTAEVLPTQISNTVVQTRGST